MRDFHKTAAATAAICGAAVCGTAFGGTVITTNLTGNAVAIVNIDARNDGAQLYNQNEWHTPFSVSGVAALPTVTLSPGSYQFRIINAADATSPTGFAMPLTPAQQSQMYTGWTYNSPWITNYLVFRSGQPAGAVQYFDGAGGAQAYGSGPAAYAGAFTDAASFPGDTDGSFNNLRYATRAGITLDNPQVVLTTTTTLTFVVPDNGLFDNNGGVSVLVTGVPEPASLGALATLSLLALRRRAGASGELRS